MSKTVIKDIPYQRWLSRRNYRVFTKEGKRVMALMGRAIKEGRAVEFWLNPPLNPTFTAGEVYDTISLTITD